MSTSQETAVIIGAGPAGLTAALELCRKSSIRPIVLEASHRIGGLCSTIRHHGNRIDIGGHRFFSKSDRVMDWWTGIMPVAEKACDQPTCISYRNQRRKVENHRRESSRSGLRDARSAAQEPHLLHALLFRVPAIAFTRHSAPSGFPANAPDSRQLYPSATAPVPPGEIAPGFSHQPVRARTLSHLLQELHRKGVGGSLRTDLRGLGRTAHQESFAAPGGHSFSQQTLQPRKKLSRYPPEGL